MKSTFLKSFGHYIEQPKVVQSAWKASKYTAVASGTALLAWDVMKADPSEKKKVAIRDGLVLGATGIGTALAVRLLMKKPFKVPPAVEELSKKYSEDIISIFKKEHKTVGEIDLISKKVDPKDLIKVFDGETLHEWEHFLPKYQAAIKKNPELAELLNKHKSREEFTELMKKMGKEDFDKYFIDEHSHGFKEMINFFVVGGASIVSGFIGGLAAQKVNKEDDEKTVAMIKEGIFQFIANIAMCAVGASVGLGISKKIFKPSQKLARFGTVGAGLMVGITGGGAIANYVGERWINPFFDKLQGKEPSHGKRKVEIWDAILHLDDLPTALALAGVEMMKPFIPLFFAFSGYRTGIGYQNHHKHSKVKEAVGTHIPGTDMRRQHLDATGQKHPAHQSNRSNGYPGYASSVQELIRPDSPFRLLHEQILSGANV